MTCCACLVCIRPAAGLLYRPCARQAMREVVDRLRRTGGPVMVIETVDVPFPLDSVDVLLEAFRRRLEAVAAKHPREALRLATIDHISSVPAIVMPARRLVPMLREAGFRRVFVDGAHGPGSVPGLDVPSLGADFYTANLHKWMFAATSAAFVYRRRPALGDEQENLHHPIISHNYGVPEDEVCAEDGFPGGWAAEARMLGTRDYAPLLSVPVAVRFYQDLGGDAVAIRNKSLALRAGNMLASAWGTRLGTPAECVGPCCMVALPTVLGCTMEESQALRTKLAGMRTEGYDAIITQYFFPAAGCLWFRLSAAAYNHMAEYQLFRDVILGLAADAEAN